MRTQRERAAQMVSKSLETTTAFDMFNKLIKMYDTLSPGNDKQLVMYMLNELGYTQCISGAWVLQKEQQEKLRKQQEEYPGLFTE